MYTPTDALRQRFHDIWVVGEERDGEIKEVTFELLGIARKLADLRQCDVVCVLLGSGVKTMGQSCIEHQADKVIVVDDSRLSSFLDDLHAGVLTGLVEKYSPEIVLCGATARGRALIPRVAVQANAGLTADCTGLAIDPDSACLLQTRPAFGGNIMATIKSMDHRPQMATVRPRVMEAPVADGRREGEVIEEAFPEGLGSVFRSRFLKTVCNTIDTVKLADARFIISGGRGIGGSEGFGPLRRLAELVDGAVGASRAAVDSGWIDYAHQVGQTGITVQPHVYVACGISGQVQHLVGMQSADLIIAINKDADAPMMQLADYAIVGDLFSVIPAICTEILRV